MWNVAAWNVFNLKPRDHKVEVVVDASPRKLELVNVSGAAAFATEGNTTDYFGCL